MTSDAVVWHDLECGLYDADLPLWLELAAAAGGRVLDVGAGTGRVALPLARKGHDVVALDQDPVLLAALRERAAGLPLTCVCADACAWHADDAVFGLCVVPMQTIHLLADRPAFLRAARRALRPGGTLAIALLGEGVEPFEVELDPETTVRDGVLYESRPTALWRDGSAIVLERRRERTDASGVTATADVVRLEGLGPAQLIAEAAAAGFAARDSRIVAPTDERAGSVVMLLEAVGTRARRRTPTAPASPEKIT